MSEEYTIDVVKRADGSGGWIEHWYCPRPMPWDEYCVLGEQWNDARTVRSIYEIEVLGVAAVCGETPNPKKAAESDG